MSIWLVRAGSAGEFESRFLNDGRIYLTWDNLNVDLSKQQSVESIRELLEEKYPEAKSGQLKNWAPQIWPFVSRMQVGDWVALPSKKKGSIHFARIKGEYQHLPDSEAPYHHARDVEWFATDIPRSNFDQDILYSLGAFMTICRISRNDAEARIRNMADNNWRVGRVPVVSGVENDSAENEAELDIERFAKDQIAKHLTANFSGHGMARIVEAVLKAKGFLTYRSPEGPDKGVDLLAAPGPLGFESPKICVQVKSGDSPVDRPTLDQLIGAMQNFRADTGLLVSWGGFRSSVDREEASQFFRVRLWDQDKLIEELLNAYDKLDEDLRAELPLKRIWAMTAAD